MQQSCVLRTQGHTYKNSDQVVGIGSKIMRREVSEMTLEQAGQRGSLSHTHSYTTLSTTATLQIRTNADTAGGAYLLVQHRKY